MNPEAPIASLLQARLVMVTGKGGTGKTTTAAALAVLGATRGRRVLLCELDMQRPGTTAVFGEMPAHEPREVRPNLFVSNVAFREALAAFIRRVVPAGRVVQLVLDNPLVRRFIDVTPGSRELVTLSRIGEFRDEFDIVIVDMPASGHAFSLLDILRSAIGLFRTGPVRRVAEDLRDVLHDDSTRVVFCALPEEMVVNETLETRAKMANAHLLGGDAIAFLNRATLPTLTGPERELIRRLGDRPLTDLQREFVLAGRWESELESATAEAQARLTHAFGAEPVLIPPSGPGGIPRHVVHGVAVHLGRQIGLSKRDIPWI